MGWTKRVLGATRIHRHPAKLLCPPPRLEQAQINICFQREQNDRLARCLTTRPARNHATRRTSLLYTHTSHNQKTNPLIDRCVPHRNQHIQVIKLCQLLFLYCQFVKRIFISITLYRRVPRRHGQTHSLSAPSRGGRVYPSVRHTHRIVMLMQDTTEP